MTYRKSLMLTLASTALAVTAGIGLPDRFLPREEPLRNAGTTKYAAQQQAQQHESAGVKLNLLSAPDDGREYVTVLEEDFSLMTAGSPESPDPNFIEGDYNIIPSKYTHTPGWGGRGVMQAGGAVCLGKVPYAGSEMTGQLETPELDLHRDKGTAYLTFRAKLLEPNAYTYVNVRWIADSGDGLPMTSEESSIPVNGVIWTTVEVTLSECPSNAVIQIYAEENEILIDDLKVEQFKPEIEAPTALKWTDFAETSFTANWTAVEGADHYVFNCFYIRRKGDEEAGIAPDYKYVARDVETKETSYHLENLKRDQVYYYYIRAVNSNGVKSEESQLVEVLDLMVPSGVKIKDVSLDGFGVSWDPVYNAEGYGFMAVLDHKAPRDETYPLLDEDFNGIYNDGKIGEPMVNTIGMYDMDSFGMSRANWTLYEGGVINGGIALHNYISSYGSQYYGELTSPLLTVGQSTGEITIEGDFATLDPGVKPYIQIAVPGVVNGQSTWVLGAGGEINKPVGKDWTHIKETYKIKPGLVRFSIGCTDGGWLYVDNLKISVNLKEGAVQRNLYRYDEIKYNLDAPEYYCVTPDRMEGDDYSFNLMAARQRPGSWMFPTYICSEWTEAFKVPSVEWSGVETIGDAGEVSFKVSGNAGAILIENPAGESLVVFDASGRTVKRTSAETETVSVAAGIYIVSSFKGEAVKVLVK